MSDDDENPQAETVGYRRPPKSGQFRKGQSGNPRGRPRKRETKPELVPARFPTGEVLRAEAARSIVINGASGRERVTTTEAVARRLALTAMQGGVLAQRTYLEHQKAEDERWHQERKANFAFWQEYQDKALSAIAAARRDGRPEPVLLPHPDDLDLNPWRLEVNFLGPVDEEGVEAAQQAQAFQRLGFEMSVYLGEGNDVPTDAGEDGRIGPYMMLYLIGWLHLPPRLRVSAEALEAEIRPRTGLNFAAWGDDLEQRCAAHNVPFIRWRRDLRLPTTPLAKLGLPWSRRAQATDPPARNRRQR